MKLHRSSFPLMSEGTIKRLKILDESRARGFSRFTENEFDMLEQAILLNSRGAGAAAPASLDINCISAPVSKVTACRSPGWIAIRCHHGNITHTQVRCRKCEGCWHVWRSKVRNIIIEGCAYEKVYMLTLTIKEYCDTMDEDRFDLIQRRWHDLLRSAGKRGLKFEYLRVVELQKRGTPHFHIAVKTSWRSQGRLSDTEALYRVFRSLARKSGFGHKAGKTIHFEAARLGGAGVASYMSKYLGKAESFNELVRPDGRAIRRYARSRGWSKSRPLPVWRYARCGHGVARTYQNCDPLPCVCGEGMLLDREVQAEKWIAANRLEGRWVAPILVSDYIFEKEKEKCQLE